MEVHFDNKKKPGAVLMDLSKAFDTINHELLIAKLHAYGFSKHSLQLIIDYLCNRLQHIKINTTFNSWSDIVQGVPQGSVLGPLLFNILKEIEVCNFADDTTPYVFDENLQVVLEKLEHRLINVTYLFRVIDMSICGSGLLRTRSGKTRRLNYWE